MSAQRIFKHKYQVFGSIYNQKILNNLDLGEKKKDNYLIIK